MVVGPFRLKYSILFYSTLFYSTLFYSILFYSILFYSILFYSILSYPILSYPILPYPSVLPAMCAPIHVFSQPFSHHQDDANRCSSKRQVTWMQPGEAANVGAKGGRKGPCEARRKGEKEQT